MLNAQRRPERQPRLHAGEIGEIAVTRPRIPLNEGRSVNPGYTCMNFGWHLRSTRPQSAQRRPERQPRLHRRTPRCLPLVGARPLNEGRSVNPGYTSSRRLFDRRQRAWWSLNEGRSVNPGYTRDFVPSATSREHRHRSTKAGASTPATPCTADPPPAGATGEVRSTKAGASTPATPELQTAASCHRTVRTSLNEGRSVNPGYTRPRLFDACHRIGPLNEGRSVNPGYTARAANVWAAGSQPLSIAQRRPERQPRLHCARRGCVPNPCQASLNEGRSVNPGYTSRREHLTLVRSRKSLNEGRSVNPGYTSPSRCSMLVAHRSAQRRPERQPRLHCARRGCVPNP